MVPGAAWCYIDVDRLLTPSVALMHSIPGMLSSDSGFQISFCCLPCVCLSNTSAFLPPLHVCEVGLLRKKLKFRSSFCTDAWVRE